MFFLVASVWRSVSIVFLGVVLFVAMFLSGNDHALGFFGDDLAELF